MFLEREVPQYTAEEREQRAHQAKRLLSDPFLMEVMEEVEAQAIAVWIQGRPVRRADGSIAMVTDAQERERAWSLIGGIHAVLGTIRGIEADAPPPSNG